jgi:hypothetical protein
MKSFARFAPLCMLILLLPAVAFAQDDEATLREIKTALWQQAYRKQDTALLDQILHESFQMVDNEGNRSTKAKELEWVASNSWDPGEFEYRIERLDIYQGRLAIVEGMGLASNYTYHSSNVLIKEDGRWQAVASHVSGFKER